jgi:SAM-dependent methyltransferase
MTIHIFRCPSCGETLQEWPPETRCSHCARVNITKDGILQLSEPQVTQDADYIDYSPVAKAYSDVVEPPSHLAQRQRGYCRRILGVVHDDPVILDLGCGPGLLAAEMASCIDAGHVIAGDVSVEMVRLARRHARDLPERIHLPVVLNSMALPILDDTLDAVVTFQMFPFVGNTERVRCEIERVTRSGGVLITNNTTSIEGDELNFVAEARNAYGDSLRKQGVKEGRAPGWSNRQSSRNLRRAFGLPEVLHGSDLSFTVTQSVEWAVDRISRRYSAFQIGVPEPAHQRAMDNVHGKLREVFGDDYSSIRQDVIIHEPLDVYRIA